MEGEQPDSMTPSDALRHVQDISRDSNNIVIVQHAKSRMRQRKVSRRQVELCVQKGTICEGPFLNARGNWQVNLFRHAAGAEVTCVVAFDWPSRLIIVTVM